jgi:hypothetical protein
VGNYLHHWESGVDVTENRLNMPDLDVVLNAYYQAEKGAVSDEMGECWARERAI